MTAAVSQMVSHRPCSTAAVVKYRPTTSHWNRGFVSTVCTSMASSTSTTAAVSQRPGRRNGTSFAARRSASDTISAGTAWVISMASSRRQQCVTADSEVFRSFVGRHCLFHDVPIRQGKVNTRTSVPRCGRRDGTTYGGSVPNSSLALAVESTATARIPQHGGAPRTRPIQLVVFAPAGLVGLLAELAGVVDGVRLGVVCYRPV